MKKDIRIKTKLIIGFLGILVINIITGVVSWSSLSQVKQKVYLVEEIKQMQDAFVKVRIKAIYYIANKDKAFADETAALISNFQKMEGETNLKIKNEKFAQQIKPIFEESKTYLNLFKEFSNYGKSENEELKKAQEEVRKKWTASGGRLLNIFLDIYKSNKIETDSLIFKANILIIIFILSSIIAVILIAFIIIKFMDYNINNLVNQTMKLNDGISLGNLNVRADKKDISIEFHEMIDGLNSSIESLVEPLKIAAININLIAKGNIPEKISKNYNGDFNEIKNNINSCIDAINNLVADANILAVAAIDGKLAIRADAAKHTGSFKEIIDGLNGTMNAIAGPMTISSIYLDRISKGDMPPLITSKFKGDYEALKENFNILIESTKEISEKAKLVANGDLTVDLKVRSNQDVLIISINEMIKSVSDVVMQVKNVSDNIADASKQMSSNSQQVSEGASEQASSAEEVSSSMEQMSSNIEQNTDNSQQTEKIAAKAAEDILVSSSNVITTVESMKKIAEKVSIIGDIAFQTNILALNAAVEAARAGEHGRGFAVVAAEVRKLAERSHIAAGEIDELTKSSVDVADKSGRLLESIVPDIQKTAKLVQEITSASIEQNSGASQINNAINQLNKVTQQNAAAAEQMATSAEELSSQVDSLRELINFFIVNEVLVTSKITNKQKSFSNDFNTTKSSSLIKSNGFNLDLGSDSNNDNDFEKF